MHLPRRILFPFLILPFFPLFARSQGPIPASPSSAESARGYENSSDGLRWQLQDILNAARNQNREKLESLIRQTEIQNYEDWFTKTFGREKGESWAEPYGRNLAGNEKNFEDLFTQLAEEDGEFSARRINDDPAPARPVEAGMVNVLQRPVDIFFASWKKRDSPQGSKSISIGYFVFLDGKFRWDSAISATELQPDPALDNAATQLNPPEGSAGAPVRPPAAGNTPVPGYPGAGGIGYPSCDYCPDPQYTKLARKKRMEGTVLLKAIVQADGGVTDIQVMKSPSPELTEMALEGVSKWHMNPARRADGEPVPVFVPIEVVFRLVK
jgi:TonB family protein